MEGYFEIGKIAGTHGIKGTLKVFPTTDDPRRFSLLKKVIIELRGKREEFNVASVSYHKQFVLLTLKEIGDINIAETYKTGTILIDEADALPLEENEYYARDLYDMEVFESDGEMLGTITDIIETGANDVYEVTNTKTGEVILIPAIKDCIVDVDTKNKKMTVKLLKGLRD